MNQLKEWGFSGQWWRGERGEYWVVAQTVLFLGFVLLPAYPGLQADPLTPTMGYIRWGTIVIFGLIAALMMGLGGLQLGQNLTPLPHPKAEGALVTSGVYGLVRHPLYSGVIFAAITYSSWQWSWVHGLGTLIFFLFFDLKARKEEAWLTAKFADYGEYQTQVKKLIPWLY